MARPLAFQAGKDGSEPSGVTAEWTGARFQPGLISPATRVRISPPQRRYAALHGTKRPGAAPHSGVVQWQDVALLRQLSGFESLHQSAIRMVLRARWSGRHPVKVEIAGSSPVSAAYGRLAQRKSARSTGGGSEGQHLQRLLNSCGVTESTADYESAGEGSSPSRSTHARLAQWESTAFTTQGQRSDSVAGYCDRFRSDRGAGS